MKASLIFSTSLLILCASVISKSQAALPEPVVKTPRVLEIEKKRKVELQRKRLLRDQKLVLKKKAQMKQAQTQKIELLSPAVSQLGEKQLYEEIVSKYDENQEFGFFSRAQNFMSRFPKSPLADEVLYLSGMMHLNQKRFAKAIQDFGRIQKQYPRSNRAVAAQFAKAMAYRRMNLPELAQRNLIELRKRYPGSPESFRAEAELKMFR